ncbi:MAG: hypothetical protein JO340_21390 [Acidobacteriaceae bacterium]|nr:hypothetical protein [Acidobacteriaceae bacterium]
MQKRTPPKKRITAKRPLSLHPLSFDEAVTDILKAKPEAKPAKDNGMRDRPIRLKAKKALGPA